MNSPTTTYSSEVLAVLQDPNTTTVHLAAEPARPHLPGRATNLPVKKQHVSLFLHFSQGYGRQVVVVPKDLWVTLLAPGHCNNFMAATLSTCNLPSAPATRRVSRAPRLRSLRVNKMQKLKNLDAHHLPGNCDRHSLEGKSKYERTGVFGKKLLCPSNRTIHLLDLGRCIIYINIRINRHPAAEDL